VSIIIPFYNNATWLSEAVESVLSQTYINYEIIVVNDGSSEDMSGFLSSYGGKITYIKKENQGPASARNLGIDKANGEYVAFLDSDDLWLPDKLRVQIEKMRKHNAVWSCCGYETFGDDNPRKILVPVGNEEKPSYLYSKKVATPSVIIKADVLKNNREFRFNQSIRYGEDTYLWMLLILYYPVLSLKDILVKVRMHGTNASKRAYIQIKARADFWRLRKEKAALFKNNKNVPLYYKVAFNMCIAGCGILSSIEKFTSNKTILEYSARFLFVLPYVIFKIRKTAI
jgi:glycosyltransferase involved in cell wall biosynthesis